MAAMVAFTAGHAASAGDRSRCGSSGRWAADLIESMPYRGDQHPAMALSRGRLQLLEIGVPQRPVLCRHGDHGRCDAPVPVTNERPGYRSLPGRRRPRRGRRHRVRAPGPLATACSSSRNGRTRGTPSRTSPGPGRRSTCSARPWPAWSHAQEPDRRGWPEGARGLGRELRQARHRQTALRPGQRLPAQPQHRPGRGETPRPACHRPFGLRLGFGIGGPTTRSP